MAKPNKARVRQIVLIAGIGVLLVSVISIGLYVADQEKPARPSAPQKVQGRQLKSPGAQVQGKEVSQSIVDARIAELEEVIKRSNQESKEREEKAKKEAQEKERARETERLVQDKARADEAAKAARGDSGVQANGSRNYKIFDPSKLGADAPHDGQGSPAQDIVPQRRLFSVDLDPTAAAIRPAATAGAAGNYSDLAKVGESLRGLQTSSNANQPPRTAQNYVPSGTFFKVSVINGIDAPTGGQAQNNPLPMLLQVTSYGSLPNQFKTDVKSCHVIGQGWGDISSERAYVRTESLSCVRSNGGVIDIPISGYIVGGDGKVGLRGRPQSKQGRVLANALWASMLGSFGDVAKAASTSVNIYTGASAMTNGNTLSTSDLMQRGALGGVGEAAKQLSQYYIQLAERTMPVIEIDGGQTADIVLSQGVSLSETKQQSQGTFSNLRAVGQSINSISNFRR